MSTISRTGVVDGQVLYADHVTRIIDALDGTSATLIVGTGSFTGSFNGELIGRATSASFASTASYYSGSVISASYAVTSSFSNNSTYAINSAFATTASFVTLAQTASFVQNAQTASFVTGSNVFGPFGSNSVISSSFAISSSNSLSSSFAISSSNSLSSSFALTASYALNVISPFPFTGSALITGSLGVTGSLNITGSAIFQASSSIEVVRITQTGTGDAIRIEDTTNPDATPTVITADGSVLIGTGSSSATTKLYVKNGSSGVSSLPIPTSLIVENSTTNYIGLFSPNAVSSGIYMGSPSDGFGAVIRWGHTDGNVTIGAQTVNHGIKFVVGNKDSSSLSLTPSVAGLDDANALLTLTGSMSISRNLTVDSTSSLKGVVNIGNGLDGTLIIPLNNSITTSDATPSTLITLPTISGSIYTVTGRVLGFGNTPETIGGDVIAVFKNIAGTLSQVSSSVKNVIEDFSLSPDFDLTTSGTNILLQVTGVTTHPTPTTITWAGQIQYISYDTT